MLVRALQISEAEIFHALRLRGLRESPEPFAASYEEDAALSREAVRDRFPAGEDRFIFGAFDPSGQLVGAVGFLREPQLKRRHWGMAWGMYVIPEARGLGVGRELMTALIERCQRLDGLEQIVLAAATVAKPARRLYESVGFETCGVQKDAMKEGGKYYDVEYMALRLIKRPGICCSSGDSSSNICLEPATK